DILDDFIGVDNGVFNNSGTLNKTSFGFATIGVDFNNTGTIDVQQGNITFSDIFTQDSGSFNLVGGNATINNANFNGGTFGGFGTLTGNINTSAILDIGEFNNTEYGQFIIDGNYTETNDAIIDIEIGGYTSGTEFDFLDIMGVANFDGTVNISLLDGFLPVLGDTFEIINFDSYTGALDFTGLSINDELEFNVEYASDKITLVVGERINAFSPDAVDDIATVASGETIIIDVLNNDSDADNNTISIEDTFLLNTANGGTVTLNRNSTPNNPTDDTLVYNAPTNFTGDDTFTYSITDGDFSDTATVTVTVTGDPISPPVDLPPIVANHIMPVFAQEDAADTILDLSNVFTDPDNDDSGISISVLSNSNSSLVNASMSGDNLILDYQPDQFGFSFITLQATSNGKSVTEAFGVIVDEVIENQPPVVDPPIPDQIFNADQPFTLPVMGNFSDPDGDSLHCVATLSNGDPLPSWLIFDPHTHRFTGNPTSSDVGTISVTVTADDGNGGMVSDTFDLEIKNPDPLPSANNDAGDAKSGEVISIDVLANDTGEGISLDNNFPLTTPLGGTVTLNDNNTPNDGTDDTLTYTAPVAATGNDTFTYSITDSNNNSDSATVTIAVNIGEGTPGDDYLICTDNDDIIRGLGGNDTLQGLGGNDSYDGGEGDDTFVISGGGIDTIQDSSGNDTLDASNAGGGSYIDLTPGGSNTSIDGGTVTLGGSLNDNSVIVFVVDISASTIDAFAGTSVGDLNADNNLDQVVDAEIDGGIVINQLLIDQGLGNSADIAIVSFESDATQEDGVVKPLTDINSNSIPDVEETLRSLIPNVDGSTNYEAALQEARQIFSSLGTASGDGNLIFLSDGEPNPDDQVFTDEVSFLQGLGVNLYAFGIGADSALPALQIIDPNALIVTSTDQLRTFFEGRFGNPVQIENAIGTAFDDTIIGNDADNILTGNGGSDIMQGGLGNDTYVLDAFNAAGSHIQDSDGMDTLTLLNGTLSLTNPATGTIGLQRNDTDLIIDISQDGITNINDDLTIHDFFTTGETSTGVGFIETVGNLNGSDIIDFFSIVVNQLKINVDGNIEDNPLQSYGDGSSFNGSSLPQDTVEAVVTYLDNGNEVKIENNAWKAWLPFEAGSYTITPDTVLTFDYMSTEEGEIQAIGFDDDDNFFDETERLFQVFGTQIFANVVQDFNNYNIVNHWKSYSINVGNYYTGTFDRIVFANDNDTPDSLGSNSSFRNLVLFEDTIPNNPPVANDDNYTTDEATIINENFVSNDEDLDNDPLNITEINGSMFTEDTPIPLASGALLTINNDGTFSYNPNNKFDNLLTGQTATDSFTYTISDGEDTDTAIVNLTINGSTLPTITNQLTVTIDETAISKSLERYGDDSVINGNSLPQDTDDAIVSYGNNGNEVKLENNAWKSWDLGNYNVTANTHLSFQFRSEEIGELQGIGFDDNDDLFDNPHTFFQLYGSDTYTALEQDFNNYQPLEGWKDYQISLGQYFTGNYDRLVFFNDFDANSNLGGEAEFRNVVLSEVS
ncbi:MAG: Ig-like domain-containing protein, partial [Crocosphaera sp.]